MCPPGHRSSKKPGLDRAKEQENGKRKIREGLLIEKETSCGDITNDKGLDLSKLWLGLFQK